MIELLNEISESPGILGTCVYSTEQGIIAANLPVRVSASVQQKIGQLLQQIFELKDVVTLKVSSFEIQFNQDLILAKKIDATSALFVLCGENTNMSLINMSINLLTEDLAAKTSAAKTQAPEAIAQPVKELEPQQEPSAETQVSAGKKEAATPLDVLGNDLLNTLSLGKAKKSKKVEKQDSTPKVTKPVVQPQAEPQPEPMPAVQPKAPVLSYAKVINGPLAAELQMIKAALSKSIGPFTGIVLEDGINEWLKNGKSQQSELNDLVQILAKEIEDVKPRQSFINDLTTLFSSQTTESESNPADSSTAGQEGTTNDPPAQAEQPKSEASKPRKKERLPKSFGGQLY